MRQRGRKSTDQLSLVTALPEKLPEPPQNLTPPQVEVWKLVIGSRGGDMIDPEAFPILVEYCRAVTMADEIAAQLAEFDPKWVKLDEGLRRWDRLTAMQARTQGVIATLGVKLRISPSSRIRADKAGPIAAKGAKRRPWESE